jgi:hypothetical protein
LCSFCPALSRRPKIAAASLSGRISVSTTQITGSNAQCSASSGMLCSVVFSSTRPVNICSALSLQLKYISAQFGRLKKSNETYDVCSSVSLAQISRYGTCFVHSVASKA